MLLFTVSGQCDKLHLVSSQACHFNWTKQIHKLHIISLKNPNWQEEDQLATYKHDQGVELGSTKKQLQLSGQSSTWTRDCRIKSLMPQPLGHSAIWKSTCASFEAIVTTACTKTSDK